MVTYSYLVENGIPVSADAKDFAHVQDMLDKAHNNLHTAYNTPLPDSNNQRDVILYKHLISEAFEYLDMVSNHLSKYQFETRKAVGEEAYKPSAKLDAKAICDICSMMTVAVKEFELPTTQWIISKYDVSEEDAEAIINHINILALDNI